MLRSKIFPVLLTTLAFLLCGGALPIEARNSSPAIASPRQIVPTKIALSGQKIEHASPAVADFDGDGDKEIAIGGRDGMLYVLSYQNNSWGVVWQRQVVDDLNAAGAPTSCPERNISDFRSAPAIADMNGDGKLELVVTTGGYQGPADTGGTNRNGGVLIYTYDSAWNFSVVPGWPQPKKDVTGKGPGASDPDGCWDGIYGAPTLADIDNDGVLDVIVNSLDRSLHAWKLDGTYLNGWPKNQANLSISRGGWSTPAVADIDGDGKNEIIIGTDNVTAPGSGQYKLFAFDDDSSVMPGFPVIGSSNFVSSPALGDLNGDGKLDIIVGTGSFESGRGNKVYAWDASGQPLPGWPQTTDGDMQASPALGDLDGDGDLEVVIGCGKDGDPSPPPCTRLYAWHGDGTSVNGFPMTPANGNPWGDVPNGLPNSPILADFDGDGQIEILVVTRWSWAFSIVESNGTDSTLSRLLGDGGDQLSGSPVVDDLDGDGLLEIAIGGRMTDGRGAMLIWDVAGAANSARPWPMINQNVMRTGIQMAEPVPQIAAIAPILLMHDPSDGRQALGQFLIQNSGRGSYSWRIRHSINDLTVTPSSGTSDGSVLVQLSYTAPGGTAALAQQKELGNLTLTATDADGNEIAGSPQTIPVNAYIGTIHRAYLPGLAR